MTKKKQVPLKDPQAKIEADCALAADIAANMKSETLRAKTRSVYNPQPAVTDKEK